MRKCVSCGESEINNESIFYLINEGFSDKSKKLLVFFEGFYFCVIHFGLFFVIEINHFKWKILLNLRYFLKD